jgi:diacylglycerol kinase (ATP)
MRMGKMDLMERLRTISPMRGAQSASGTADRVVKKKAEAQDGAFQSSQRNPMSTMQRVAVIYNPASGQQSSRREKDIQYILSVLNENGISTHRMETSAPGSAGKHAREALHLGCDAVLACGGDGTVHEIIQELVGKSIALGVIPMGTANALAQNLRLGRSPAKAIRSLLTAVPAQIPVGRIHFKGTTEERQTRFFTVAAGIGADALLMSALDATLKRRLGYVLYLIEAARVWLTNSFPVFRASFKGEGHALLHEAEVSQILAIRVRSFGGALGELAPGATLHGDKLRLIAFKTRSRMRYLLFLLGVLAGRQTFSGAVELLDAIAVDCRQSDGSGETILVEADGEVLGSLPARLEIADEKLTILIPPDARP